MGREEEPAVELGLRAAIAAGDPASRLVFSDWQLEQGVVRDELECEPTGPHLAPKNNEAAPFPRDEEFRGVWLYERLSNQVDAVRHNPTNTSWVYAYRGLWLGVPVIAFRPGPWLLGPDGTRSGDTIIEDLGARALHAERLPDYSWAMVEAPAGIRLRALVYAVTLADEGLPDDVVLDLVVRTRALLDADTGADTFVQWDGSLWLSPRFLISWNSEMPSIVGDEVYDGLVLEHPDTLRELFSPNPQTTGDEVRSVRAYIARLPRALPPVPALLGPRARAILDDIGAEYRPDAMHHLYARCKAAASAPSDHCARMLAAALRRHFPDAYDRQRRALASVGIDIDQPWVPRRER